MHRSPTQEDLRQLTEDYWFTRLWSSQHLDSVVGVNHAEVSFESDESRLEDKKFRDDVAMLIDEFYKSLLNEKYVGNLSGNRDERVASLVLTIAEAIKTTTV